MSASKTAPSAQGASDAKPGRSTAVSGSPGEERSGDETPDGSPENSRGSSQSKHPKDERSNGRWSFFDFLFRRSTSSKGESAGAHDSSASHTETSDAANGEVSPAERLMIDNILRLRNLRVEDTMTPRADIVAVPEEASLDDAMAAFKGCGHSRLPVFRDTLDDPTGFVHLKDLAVQYGVGREKNGTKFSISRHMHQALFVPPSMGIVALLQRMQGEHVHMALVIDEFGGVDGLVTIEDLVEQIVGEIEDEHDTSNPRWRMDAPGVWTIEARADIEEFEASTGLHLRPPDWDEDADTLGGLVFMLAGKVPARGEVITHPLGHEFQILDADPRRIKHLRLTLNKAGGPAE